MASIAHSISLRVRDLSARRGGRVVAEGIRFEMAPGSALTLRGENGTGKTSILRAIAGFSAVPDGAITFSQNDVPLDLGDTRAHHIHVLGGDDGLAARLTVAETIQFWAGLLGAPPKVAAGIAAQLDLSDIRDRPAGKLSTGQRRRLGLARLVMAPRAIWLLDEPMSGLDDAGREYLAQAIAHHRADGGVALMASHEESLPDAPVLRLNAPRDAS